MNKLLTNLWHTITAPFICLAVTLDESKRINEDGRWDKYNAKRNGGK